MRLSVIFNVDIPLQNGWEVNEWLDVVDGHWGDWGTIHICPKDHYAMSLRVRDEEYQHSGDDTALNGLQSVFYKLIPNETVFLKLLKELESQNQVHKMQDFWNFCRYFGEKYLFIFSKKK